MKKSKDWTKSERFIFEASALEDEGKISAAIKRYRIAARMGDPIAQSNLATLLDDKAIPARPKEAVYWYKRAVKSGHCSAAWNLSMHYQNSDNKRWSRYWLKVAAKMGDEDAIETLTSEGRTSPRKISG